MSRVLWIDALCMDQNDITERNHQVAQMDKVYKHTRRVLVWLGPEAARDLRALPFIRNKQPQVTLRSAGSHTQFHNSAEAPIWQEVVRLCQRPYWSRLWIIQEVFFAAKIILYCCDSSCDWENFEKICSFVDYSKTTEFTAIFPVVDQIIESIPYRLNRQREQGVSQTRPLFELLITYQEAMCVDSRDKVFGLHSLAARCCQEAVAIDYSKSAFTVCRELLQHYFLVHHAQSDSLVLNTDCSDVVERSYLAHKILCKFGDDAHNPSVYLSRDLPKFGTRDLKLIRATGNIRGEICHTTISLDSLLESDLSQVFYSKNKPSLSIALVNSIDYISHSSKLLHLPSTLTDVCTFQGPPSFSKQLLSSGANTAERMESMYELLAL
jgi:Heterokaryon incompatibility protein (HET)